MQQFLRMLVVCLFIFMAIPQTYAGDAFTVGQINQVNNANQTLLVSDSPYRYDSYLVVRRFGASEDQRLPVSSLTNGMWVAIEATINHRLGLPKASTVLIFKSKAAALAFESRQ